MPKAYYPDGTPVPEKKPKEDASTTDAYHAAKRAQYVKGKVQPIRERLNPFDKGSVAGQVWDKGVGRTAYDIGKAQAGDAFYNRVGKGTPISEPPQKPGQTPPAAGAQQPTIGPQKSAGFDQSAEAAAKSVSPAPKTGNVAASGGKLAGAKATAGEAAGATGAVTGPLTTVGGLRSLGRGAKTMGEGAKEGDTGKIKEGAKEEGKGALDTARGIEDTRRGIESGIKLGQRIGRWFGRGAPGAPVEGAPVAGAPVEGAAATAPGAGAAGTTGAAAGGTAAAGTAGAGTAGGAVVAEEVATGAATGGVKPLVEIIIIAVIVIIILIIGLVLLLIGLSKSKGSTYPQYGAGGYTSMAGFTATGILAEDTKRVAEEMKSSGAYGGGGGPVSNYLATISFPIKRSDGSSGTMAIQTNKVVAANLQAVFQEIYATNFVIKPGTHSYRSGQGTGGAGCISAHRFGLATDVNPDQNPYCKNCARPAPDAQKGVITDEVVSIFARYGWRWGGYWTRVKDYMHFSPNRQPVSGVCK